MAKSLTDNLSLCTAVVLARMPVNVDGPMGEAAASPSPGAFAVSPTLASLPAKQFVRRFPLQWKVCDHIVDCHYSSLVHFETRSPVTQIGLELSIRS